MVRTVALDDMIQAVADKILVTRQTSDQTCF